MNKFEELKALVADMEKDADLFYSKKVKVAGKRFRSALLDARALINEARVEVLEITKAGKDS